MEEVTEKAYSADDSLIALFRGESLCSQLVPDEQLGKVFFIRQLLLRSAIPLGILLGSQLGELWGIRSILFFIDSIIRICSLMGMLLPFFIS